MIEQERIYTVVVGDLVGSSKASARQEKALKIESTLHYLSTMFPDDFLAPLTLVRGMDELSGVLVRPDQSYHICTLLNEAIFPLRFRFAIVQDNLDVGTKSKEAGKMDGPAFHRASRLIPMLKLDGALYGFRLAPPMHEFNELLSQLASLAGIIQARRTERQNDIFRKYRQLQNQKSVAAELGIKQQAVSDAMIATSWKQVEVTERLITRVLSGFYRQGDAIGDDLD